LLLVCWISFSHAWSCKALALLGISFFLSNSMLWLSFSSVSAVALSYVQVRRADGHVYGAFAGAKLRAKFLDLS
jgi:hypothetical protein